MSIPTQGGKKKRKEASRERSKSPLKGTDRTPASAQRWRSLQSLCRFPARCKMDSIGSVAMICQTRSSFLKLCADGNVHTLVVCVCACWEVGGNKAEGLECKQSMSYRGDTHSLQWRRAKSDKLFIDSNVGTTIRAAAIISWLMVACHLPE